MKIEFEITLPQMQTMLGILEGMLQKSQGTQEFTDILFVENILKTAYQHACIQLRKQQEEENDFWQERAW